MCIEVTVCNVSVVFVRHSVLSLTKQMTNYLQKCPGYVHVTHLNV